MQYKRNKSASLITNNLNYNPSPSPRSQSFRSAVNDFEAKTVSLFSQPYLDTYNQCYKNIVVVNLMPKGPLSEFVRFIQFPPLSEFKQPGPCSHYKSCGYALISLSTCGLSCGKFDNDLMDVNEVPNLISFLVNNGYSVDTSITKMFNDSDIRFDTITGNKLICFITYNGI